MRALSMENTKNSFTEVAQTTTTPTNVTAHYGIIEIDYTHPLYLYPNDTLGSSLISIQLISSENYAL